MATIHFKGKSYVQNHHLTLKYHHLVPNSAASLTDKISLHDNLIIHGDNLLALKALLPTYAGKVKCIYIDPPYNTGNEGWIYNDNVNSPMMQDWLKANAPIDKEDLARHDKWLCMMMPRLKLLRELLRDDGVIFISIDDNEVHHLKMLMDEIFGEINFIGSLVWEKGKKGDSRFLSITHEYVLVFGKDKNYLIEKNIRFRQQKAGVDQVLEFYSQLREKYVNKKGEIDHQSLRKELMSWYRKLPKGHPAKSHKHYNWSDDRGLYFPADFAGPDDGRESRPRYEIVHPITRKNCAKPSTGWRWEEGRTLAAISEKPSRIHFGDDETTIPCRKSYLYEVKEEPFSTVFYKDGRAATLELERILGKNDMSFPKDVEILSNLISLTCSDSDIVLDSFAGSGTTAQAVLALNKEDRGNRKFILIEMEDYADSLTAERVRRVIKGVPKAKDETLKNGLGGSFSFFELGEPIEMQAILEGGRLPAYEDLARYVFYTATGDEFDPAKIDHDRHYIGENHKYEVYLFYRPDLDYLRSTALDLDKAEKLGLPKPNAKRRLVFAPMKYLDSDTLERYWIEYCQLPFEIYK